MIRFQRGYQASSRVMSTVDEMLDTLINRTGRVGPVSAGRITEGMTGRRLLSRPEREHARASRSPSARSRPAAGSSKPSDDPLATHNALRLRSELAGIAQRPALDRRREGLARHDRRRARRRSPTSSSAPASSRSRARTARSARPTATRSPTRSTSSSRRRRARRTPPTAGATSSPAQDTDDAAVHPGRRRHLRRRHRRPIARQIGAGQSDPGQRPRRRRPRQRRRPTRKLLTTLRTLAADLRSGNLAGAPRRRRSTGLEANLEDVTSARGVVGALTTRLEAAERPPRADRGGHDRRCSRRPRTPTSPRPSSSSPPSSPSTRPPSRAARPSSSPPSSTS